MDWNDLRFFLAAARERSLAGAARRLSVEHTTVSRRLTALETALFAKLFTRSSDGLALTDVGQKLLPQAEAVERTMQVIERTASGCDERIEGVVRVTTSEAFSGFLVKRMGPLREKHPALVVEMLSGNRTFDLLRGEADLAIRLSPVTQGDLVGRKVGDSGWSVYAAPSYLKRKGTPSSIDDLREHDVIGFDETMANLPGAKWLETRLAGANIVMRGNSIVSAFNAAVTGFGIAVLPCLLIEKDAGLARITPDVVSTRDIWLVMHPDLAKLARVRAVIDFIGELIERERTMISGKPSLT